MPSPVQVVVHTADAHPDDPAYKLSRRAGHDVADVQVTLAPDPGRTYGALVMSFSPTRTVRPVLFQRGLVCGLGQRCGTPRALQVATGVFTDHITTAELGPGADGDYPVYVHAINDLGWL